MKKILLSLFVPVLAIAMIGCSDKTADGVNMASTAQAASSVQAVSTAQAAAEASTAASASATTVIKSKQGAKGSDADQGCLSE